MVSQPLDVADYDLVVSRMMMQHLNHADVIRILHNLSNITSHRRRHGGGVFLLATTFSNTAVNAKLDVNNAMRYAMLNLEVDPFRLETPLCLFREGPPDATHFMGLWRLPVRAIAEGSCSKPVAVSTPLSKRPMFSCVNWTLMTSKVR